MSLAGELESTPLALPEGLEVSGSASPATASPTRGGALHRPLRLARAASDVLLRRARAARPGDARPLFPAPGAVAGVLVGHTHFDHAVDAPAIARRFGCQAYGSASLAKLMALHGLAELAVEVAPYAPTSSGRSWSRFVPSAALEAAARLAGPVRRRADLRSPRRPLPERLQVRPGLGDPDRGRGHQPLPPGQRQPDRRRARASAASTSSSPGSPAAASPRATGSGSCPGSTRAIVVPTHYDDFFAPLGQRASLIRRVNLEIGARGDLRRFCGCPCRGPSWRIDLGGII